MKQKFYSTITLKTIVTFFLLTICSTLIKAQNLVPNYSFEEYTICPIGPDELNYALSWYSSGASPDYFNECSTNPYFFIPGNWFGFQYAKPGKVMLEFLFIIVSILIIESM